MIRFASLFLLAGVAVAMFAAEASAQYGVAARGVFRGPAVVRQRVFVPRVAVVNPVFRQRGLIGSYGQLGFQRNLGFGYGAQHLNFGYGQQAFVQQAVVDPCYGQNVVQQFATPVVGSCGVGYGGIGYGNLNYGTLGFGNQFFRAGFGVAPVRARVVIR